MDPQRPIDPHGRVRAARAIRIEQHYLHEAFSVVIPGTAEETRTGRFVLFRVVPRENGGFYHFIARFDNAALNRRTPGTPVKIDVDGETAAERLAFKRGRHGHSGHWPVEEDSGRRFRIEIVDRGRRVLTATLTFAVTFGVDLNRADEVTIGATLEDGTVFEVPFATLLPQLMKRIRGRHQSTRARVKAVKGMKARTLRQLRITRPAQDNS